MASLSETNPYLRDKKKLEEMVARNTYDSSVFEGASPLALSKLRAVGRPRAKARSKKPAKSE